VFFKNLRYIFRSFRKDKFFVFINLFGMSAGILVTLLTGFYAFYKVSYDKFVKDHDRIYRLEYTNINTGNETPLSWCSQSLAEVMKEEVPGIKDIMTILKTPLTLKLECDGIGMDLDSVILASRNFLDHYNIKFIRGTKESALQESRSLILTRSLAQKFFGDEDPLGRELKFINQTQSRFRITGIIEDLPPNSHIKATAISLDQSQSSDAELKENYDPENLTLAFKYIYLILEENSNIDRILDYFPILKEKYLNTFLEEKGYDLKLTATKLSDTHFKEELLFDFPTENIRSIYYFLLTAIVVIIISIINFVNLSLARFAYRKTDVGIRKTLGAGNKHIFWLYMLESFLSIIISFAIAFIIFLLLLPIFSDLMNITLNGMSFPNYTYFLVFAFMIVTGIFSGLYPASVNSLKNPLKILKDKTVTGTHKGIITFIVQMILSIVIIITTLVIFLQMKYVNNFDTGCSLENVIAYEFHNYGPGSTSSKDICEMLKRSAYIDDVAVSTKLPGQEMIPVSINIKTDENIDQISTSYYNIDENYIPFMGIEILYGNNFSKELAPDSNNVIVNESFIKGIIEPGDAVGTVVFFPGRDESEVKFETKIIGVVRDFHFQTLHNKIGPLLLINTASSPNFFHIKYNKQNFREVLDFSRNVFDELGTNNIFAAIKHFPEEELLQQYESEKNLSQITIWLAVLSIFLNISGLFAITAYLVRNNLKMLCIRKVFGAERSDLFKLLIKHYRNVLIISNAAALPLAWYICSLWLQRFAYHISLSFWLFLSGMIISVLILVIALIYHVIMVDKTDPAVILQYE